MTKKIFKKLNPDIIATAIFEIRFNLATPETSLLGQLYPILIKDYPKLEQRSNPIPREIRTLDPNLKFFVDYTFSNEGFSVSFGPNALVFEYLSDYQGWDHFLSCINKFLSKVDKAKIFKSATRLGLRYINIVEGNPNINDVLDFNTKVGIEGYDETNIIYRNELHRNDVKVILNVASQGKIGKKGVKEKQGLLLDIDVVKEGDFPKFGTDLLPTINRLHDEEKIVFTNILRQSYIDSLNPEY